MNIYNLVHRSISLHEKKLEDEVAHKRFADAVSDTTMFNKYSMAKSKKDDFYN